MTITVYLHTILQKQTAEGVLRSLELSIPEGSKVEDVLARLEIKIDPDDLLITVNGQVADESQVLIPGDRVDFNPCDLGRFRSIDTRPIKVTACVPQGALPKIRGYQ